MELKEHSSLVIEDKLNFVSNKIRFKDKNIVKKSPDLFLQIKYVITGICFTLVSDNTHWSPSTLYLFRVDLQKNHSNVLIDKHITLTAESYESLYALTQSSSCYIDNFLYSFNKHNTFHCGLHS